MGYIIKNSTQGAIVARLTDAGRKKLSEGKLNISLFQLGDSEMCYDCYKTLPGNATSPSTTDGIKVLQAEHNAQNLLGLPEKNKGHVKYPFLEDDTSSGNNFGPTIPQHTYEEVFNTATPRGFFSGTTNSNGSYTSFTARTSQLYNLNPNWLFCGSAMTGSSIIQLISASTACHDIVPNYTPVNGDLLSVTYQFSGTNCSELNYLGAAQTLWYQVISGNANSGQTNGKVFLTLDRQLPNFTGTSYSALSATCAHVRVYPPYSANPMTTTSIYSSASTISYWCNDTLSFNSCCDISTSDVKIWNMNINWTHQVAGVSSPSSGIYEGVDYYGSSGYCGSKEYFGYESSNGQTFSDLQVDSYHDTIVNGTWYVDSFGNTRVVEPEEQKCIGICHYTNNTTTDFYGEKFALKYQGSLPLGSTIGEAKNFKVHLPWLMWHKKSNNGSGNGTGKGDETIMGQTFYVDPPNFPNAFPAQPEIMYALPNGANMNDDGLRYYHLYDDNPGNSNSNTLPNRVGKVFPDYKLFIIDDQELLAAMSYKSNRSFTLPSPKTAKIPAGTACVTSACTAGVVSGVGDRIYFSYLFVNNSGIPTGLHCNNYVWEEYDGVEPLFDVAITFGAEFPYLRPQGVTGPGVPANNGTGWEADRLYLLVQVVTNGSTVNMQPDPSNWQWKDVTNLIPNHTVGDKIVATNLVDHTFYINGNDTTNATTCPAYTAMTAYTLNDFINVPVASTGANDLQFGDEYFLYGTVETDIMATIYEMKHLVKLDSGQYDVSTNPTWVDYNTTNSTTTTPKLTEIGLFDNENGFPDLMAIAKFQSPVPRTGTQQFTIAIDF